MYTQVTCFKIKKKKEIAYHLRKQCWRCQLEYPKMYKSRRSTWSCKRYTRDSIAKWLAIQIQNMRNSF